MIPAWLVWALLSALFAALTAIFAKAGVAGIPADLATFLRTAVILAWLALVLTLTGGWQGIGTLPRGSALFLTLSGLATGASWLCYFRALQAGEASRVAPIDKLSVVLVALFAATFLGERLSPAAWAGVAMIAAGALLVARG
ncbi:EamA family transporter [Rhodobacteraceae bacterium DSL-40]|uniref:EamA family transporter n=1 Tax=Amaricoccus sp. B4 TaxID=3368557 RepID=UPI000DAB675A